ncbi:MAG TPA: DUF1573 domain-containing protein [Verrucomicrobiae bacterium]|nr:DUF1573 domain-containing protein [Verrucomicrobiae bacterium]
MNRQLLAVVVMAMAAVGVARADATNASTAGPKIHFDKTVYDFGATSLVDSVTGTFTFQNVGSGQLTIGKPQPSCGCTVASLSTNVLQPGETGRLGFQVRVAGQRGHLEKHITLPSNDPQASSVSLGIKVEMRQLVDVTPAQFQLGVLKQGSTTNLAVTLHRTDGQKLVVTSAQPSDKRLTVRVVPVEGTNDQSSAKLLIDVDAKGAPGALNDSVKVFLDGITQPAATVFVSGRLLGDVILSQESLFWPITIQTNQTANSEQLSVRRISVSSATTNHPLQITNLSTSLADMTLELVPVDTGKVYSVVARLTTLPQQSERGTISFETNTSLQPKVVVPVTITVLRNINSHPPLP